MNSQEQKTIINGQERVSINVDTIKELWSQTYNREGKPDWSHIFPYYHKDIVFQDTMMFKKYPNTPMYGATKLVLSEDGLIKEQRDYYDLWGDIFNNIPRFGKMYRRFLIKKFG
jgi:hypothetical protein